MFANRSGAARTRPPGLRDERYTYAELDERANRLAHA